MSKHAIMQQITISWDIILCKQIIIKCKQHSMYDNNYVEQIRIKYNSVIQTKIYFSHKISFCVDELLSCENNIINIF